MSGGRPPRAPSPARAATTPGAGGSAHVPPRGRRSRRRRPRGRTRQQGRRRASVELAGFRGCRVHSFTSITTVFAIITPMAGSGDQEVVFAYDLGSPYAWLAAERVDQLLPAPP